MKSVMNCTQQSNIAENNGGLWNESHTDSLEDDMSNDVDHFTTIDEYYKHCSTPLEWGKLHGFGPQHFDSQPASLLPTSSDNLNENKSYPCDTCGKVYKLSSSLYTHKKFECGKVPTFKCLFCPQRTYQKGSMKRHMKRIHNSEAAPLNVNGHDGVMK